MALSLIGTVFLFTPPPPPPPASFLLPHPLSVYSHPSSPSFFFLSSPLSPPPSPTSLPSAPFSLPLIFTPPSPGIPNCTATIPGQRGAHHSSHTKPPQVAVTDPHSNYPRSGRGTTHLPHWPPQVALENRIAAPQVNEGHIVTLTPTTSSCYINSMTTTSGQ